jgi:pimeloyl-ACP methyl ester carboxylesterase
MPEVMTSDGIRLHWQASGAGADLLFLHGMGSSALWNETIAQLDPSRYRSLRFDFRGHGRSGGGARGFDFPQLDEDLHRVATAADAPSSVLVGFSGGCKYAICYAQKHPGLVRGLVLVAPPGLGVVPLPREAVAMLLDTLERTGDIPAEFSPWFTEKIGSRRADIVGQIAATPRPVLDAAMKLWLDGSVTESQMGAQVPTLVVAGAREPIYGPDFQRQTTLASLPHAQMMVLDCAHFIPLEEPAALAQYVARFVDALPSTPRRLPAD